MVIIVHWVSFLYKQSSPSRVSNRLNMILYTLFYFFPNVNNKTQLITIKDPNPFEVVKPICHENQ
jgi:hypothetical protein